MILYFYVRQQTIQRIDTQVLVAGSHDYLEGALYFDDDWDNITAKYVVWEHCDSNDPAIKIMLSDNKWTKDVHLFLTSGFYNFSVHGINGDNTWITTQPIKIKVEDAGGIDGSAQISIPLDDGQQILEIANEAKNIAEQTRDEMPQLVDKAVDDKLSHIVAIDGGSAIGVSNN